VIVSELMLAARSKIDPSINSVLQLQKLIDVSPWVRDKGCFFHTASGRASHNFEDDSHSAVPQLGHDCVNVRDLQADVMESALLQNVQGVLRELPLSFYRTTADKFDYRGLGTHGGKKDKMQARELEFPVYAESKHRREPSLALIRICDAKGNMVNLARREWGLIHCGILFTNCILG